MRGREFPLNVFDLVDKLSLPVGIYPSYEIVDLVQKTEEIAGLLANLSHPQQALDRLTNLCHGS